MDDEWLRPLFLARRGATVLLLYQGKEVTKWDHRSRLGPAPKGIAREGCMYNMPATAVDGRLAPTLKEGFATHVT